MIDCLLIYSSLFIDKSDVSTTMLSSADYCVSLFLSVQKYVIVGRRKKTNSQRILPVSLSSSSIPLLHIFEQKERERHNRLKKTTSLSKRHFYSLD